MLLQNFKAIFFNCDIYDVPARDLFPSELDCKAMPQTMEFIMA